MSSNPSAAGDLRVSPVLSSAALAQAIRAEDFSACAATVIGYGGMGAQYVKALRILGVKRIRVCSRSEARLQPLRGMDGVELMAGGFERMARQGRPGELGIVAVPIDRLVEATEHLVSLGYRRLLIEKPVSLWSGAIERLTESLERAGAEAWCAYNRVAYPALQEVRALAAQEGGITSCTYTFTEFIKPDWPQLFTAEELARWGIANSLHVMSMAHALIGMPAQWHGHRGGTAVSWHPTGSVFVGSGVSEHGIPFAYHADWGSTGRWSVEVHTSVSSYRHGPLEQVLRRRAPLAEWEAMPVVAVDPTVKVGFVEQTASALEARVRAAVPLVSLRQAAALARFAESLFGYPTNGHA